MESEKRRRTINFLVDEIERQLARSRGTMNEYIKDLLDQAWELLRFKSDDGATFKSDEEDDLLKPEEITAEKIKEMQEAMDTEILSMLKSKEAYFAAIAKERELTQDEISIRLNILNFIKQIENP
jgi:hypothetical protein